MKKSSIIWWRIFS